MDIPFCALRRLHNAACLALISTLLWHPWAGAGDVPGKSPDGIRYDGGDEIILQGFHWNSSRASGESWYGTLARLAPQIGKDGFSAIWMPPPWRDESQWRDPANGTSGGGEGYFWQDFDKNSRYGSDAQLKQAQQALHGAGVKVIYDVVPNHMNGNAPGQQLSLPKGQGFWRNDCNPASACDDGDAFMAGDADLNTGNAKVYALFENEFKNLRDHYGADGLRFDFVKGYAAERVDSWMKAFGDQRYCVGELWKAPNEFPASDWRSRGSWQDALKDWSARARCSVFDFALKERFQNGPPSSWRQGLNANPDPRWREVAVTFVDNHDTGYSPGPQGGQHHWSLVEARRNQAYAYILGSPGTPTVYWPDMYDWGRGELLRQLIAIRRDIGIRADSPISFLDTYSGLVAKTVGVRGTLLLALDADLSNPPTPYVPVLTADGERIRMWRSNATSTQVPVTFRCEQGHTQPGQSVYVVGSSLELGNWKPAHAIRLTDTSEYPSWKGVIELPDKERLAWKCIVRSESDPGAQPLWQGGADNQLDVAAGAATQGSLSR